MSTLSLDIPPINPQLTAAIDAVRVAGTACRAVRDRLVSPETLEKKDKSPVTVADFASQAIVCAMLAALNPDVKIVGEEDATELKADGQASLLEIVTEQVGRAMNADVTAQDVIRWIDLGNVDPGNVDPGNVDPAQDTAGSSFWTLDPIDGTKGFIRGEQYAVALARIENGIVTLGVLGCPNLPDATNNTVAAAANAATTGTANATNTDTDTDTATPGTIFYAERGGGAYAISMNNADATPTRLKLGLNDLKNNIPRFCESVESGHSDQDQSVMIARHLGITADPVRMDSQCKYATVARGDASIYLRLPTRPGYEEKIWDHAAGLIVVEEAGGTVTDIAGTPLDFTHGRTLAKNRGVVATHGYDHAKVIDAILKTT